MATLNEILKVIDEEPVKFNSKIPDIEKKMFRDISVLLKDLKLTANGKIEPSIENLKLINSIKGRLDKILVSKEYSNLVKEFVGNFPTITNFQTRNYDVPNDTKKVISAATKLNIDNTLESLIGRGYKQEVVSMLYKTLNTNVTSGASYAEMVENLRNQLTTTEKSPGLLSKYTRTYVTDSLGQLAGQGNKMIADSLNSEWYRYANSNLTTTREFCRHLTKKKYIHKSEISEIIAGEIDGHKCKIYEATGLPHGMIKGTNVDNFIVNRGGYNCGHQLLPIPEENVPIEIRKRFGNKTKYMAENNNDNFIISQKPLKEFKGTLQEFADKVLTTGIASNEIKKLGNIHSSIIKDMKSKGVDLISNELLITDKKILKYLSHPKGAKGGVIDSKRYGEIQKAIENPTNIYEDLTSHNLVYAYSTKYDGKSLKLIVHPNYTLNGNSLNLVKSIGVVNDWDLSNVNLYRKIK